MLPMLRTPQRTVSHPPRWLHSLYDEVSPLWLPCPCLLCSHSVAAEHHIAIIPSIASIVATTILTAGIRLQPIQHNNARTCLFSIMSQMKKQRMKKTHVCMPTKTESTYQLRPRRHNRSLTMKANATNKCDFIVRMLFEDIY